MFEEPDALRDTQKPDDNVMTAFSLQRLYILLPWLCCLALPAVAQPKLPETDLAQLYSFGDDYFLEVLTMPESGTNRARVVVLSRLTYSLMTFRKVVPPGTTGDLYVATPSVYAEAQAEDGVIVDYGVWKDTIRTEEYRQTNSKHYLAPGAIELQLRPGRYTITYTIDDGTPGRRFSRTTPPFTVPDFSGTKPGIGRPIFLQARSGDSLLAAAIDGNALFGRPLLAYVPFSSRLSPTNLRYEVLSVKGEDDKKKEVETVGTGTARIVGGAVPGPMKAHGNDLFFVLRRDSVPEGAYGAFVEYDASGLDQGSYALLLEYQVEDQRTVDTVPFQLRWIDMPFSLSSTQYAVKSLYPIATDDEIDKILSVGKEKQEKALLDYWKRQDPTPATSYNERMAEYYRRVDYAHFNFATLVQADGVFTDRGKIYILFGPPTDMRRELNPGANPREIWTYNNVLRKEFIFQDRSESGAYRLVEYYDL